MFEAHTLAPAGSTAAGAYTPVQVPNYNALAIEFDSVAGGTSATIKAQGSLDSSNWFDLAYITDISDTVAVAALTLAPVSHKVIWLSNPVARQYLFFRLNVVGNTGITFGATLWQIL